MLQSLFRKSVADFIPHSRHKEVAPSRAELAPSRSLLAPSRSLLASHCGEGAPTLLGLPAARCPLPRPSLAPNKLLTQMTLPPKNNLLAASNLRRRRLGLPCPLPQPFFHPRPQHESQSRCNMPRGPPCSSPAGFTYVSPRLAYSAWRSDRRLACSQR